MSDANGNLYGTTGTGGYQNNGTLYELYVPTNGSPAVLSYQTYFGLVGGVDLGSGPSSGLVLGNDGYFYGTTGKGGGSIYKFSFNSGIKPVLFFGGTNGEYPFGGLIQGKDGNFYGTTSKGGSTLSTDTNHNGYGTVFKITPSGTLTTIYNFSSDYATSGRNSDGCTPYASLVQGTDGNFYGTTYNGGSAGNGVVFKITPAGVESVLHNFLDGSVPNDGTYSGAALVRGNDGSFYGTTENGGSPQSDGGTVFKIVEWNATDVAASSDGTSRVLWTRSDGAASLWSFGTNDTQTVTGPTYGPFSDSHGTWVAKAVGAAGNGTSRILWTRSDGAAGLWTMSTVDVQTAVGPTYSVSNNTFTAIGLGVSTDGNSKILWFNSPLSQMLVASYGVTGTLTHTGQQYGPITDSQGSWSPSALDAANDQSEVLWIRSDRAAGLWTFSTSDSNSVIGPVNGPY